ncbi:MAG: 2'-5' RNA ligase family protein, partial [Patescibacteria group bacterium]
MRYFIGNLIRGEAAEYYKATCADLASRFGVEDVSAIVAPHITVKAPFERHEIEMIDDVISMVTEAPAISLSLSKWNHFGARTIFLDAIQPPLPLKEYMKSVLSKLRAMGISLNSQEFDPHIHLSLARFLKPDQFNNIWKYLESMPAPQFDITFDNLTIFQKEKIEDKAWKVMKTFP